MAWDTGIAEGVRQGLFGLGEIKDNEPTCQYFKAECTVSFTDNEVLIRAEICQAQIAERQAQTTLTQSHTPTGSSGEFPQPTFQPTATVAPVTTGQYKQLDFNFTVPKGKVSSLMGVLNYLQSKYEHMNISLHLDRGQMTEQEYEDKVKEAFRQMGIDIDK
jgi:hypothetical protein